MQTLPNQDSHRQYHDDHLYVDLRNQLVTLDGQTVTLTRKEYELLALLVQHGGKVVPRANLLTHVWGYVPKTRTRTVDVHIGRLRQKLAMHGRFIETIFKVGYRFRPGPGP